MPPEGFFDVHGEGKVWKKILTPCSGKGSYPSGVVTFDYTARVLGSEAILDSRESVIVTLEDGSIREGLNVALRSMGEGEEAEVIILPPLTKARADEEKDPETDGNPALSLTVNVAAIAPPDFSVPGALNANGEPADELDAATRISRSEEAKVAGNEQFKAGSFSKAAKRYREALNYWSNKYLELSDSESEVAKKLKVDCGNNLAICEMKLQNYRKALTAAADVLDLDSTNVKALFRAGSASRLLSEFEDAESFLQQCLEADPTNKAAEKEKILCEKDRRAAEKKEKAMFARMLG